MAGTAAPLQKEGLLKKALEAVEWDREEKSPEKECPSLQGNWEDAIHPSIGALSLLRPPSSTKPQLYKPTLSKDTVQGWIKQGGVANMLTTD